MTDLEFVRRCAQGDKPAWDEFVERYSRLIYCYIHSVFKLKGLKSYTAQEHTSDLFQEIFVLLSQDNFKKLKTFKAKNGCSFASWLRQVVINYSIDYIRKLKPVVSLEEGTADDLTLQDILADNSPSFRELLTDQERLGQLTECINKLTTEDKFFIELYLNQALGLSQISKVLRISQAATDMRKSRIIERLKKCFHGKNFALDL